MNLLPNKFFGFESLPSENQQVASVVGRLFIENESGLLVVMESKRLDCASMAWNVPLTVNRLNLQQQGPEMGTPIEILKHMQSCEWHSFIWIPYEVAQGDVQNFTIRYAHELQHYRQSFDKRSYSKAKKFLQDKKRNGFIPLLKNEDLADELDADLASFEAFEKIFGPEALQSFLRQEHPEALCKRVISLRNEFLNY